MTQDLARQTTFANRTEAGRALVEPLREYTNRPDAIVLALPRGGVPVAYEVATALGLRLDLLVVRKLGLPSHPEYAMGAIASGASAFSMTMRSERIPSTAPVSKLCWTRKPRNCCDGKEIPGQSPTAAAQGPSGNPYRRRPGHRRLDDGRRSSGAGTGAFAHRGCGAGLAPGYARRPVHKGGSGHLPAGAGADGLSRLLVPGFSPDHRRRSPGAHAQGKLA